ncbi:MAG: N-acetyl-gamma-glutamyl-phosphate reductase, partial [Muribaculaceae bacterium]|nr:N-acetyl-gamma-glutamyl-phosphate reductase [Muribaculaceae bacterium]
TLKAYEIYDDHNFSFAVTSPVKLDDVKGTEKIIISLSRSKDGVLSIHSVADGRLRGSAGEAVHVMNLMFGLHEKTGLYLKPYAF